ncbi:MAG TPA: hypothetical protein VE973_03365 [Candidatus Limnocylindria bacterium]|nr:hypothetical protein [Candidatus Limnocylindria bacterium]
MKSKKLFLNAVSLLLPLFFAAMPVYAAEIVGPSGGQGNVILGAQESHKNLYVGGGNLTVNSNISGDLTAVGGMLDIIGNVENEALIAGGNISISGSLGGNSRVAGGNITISGPINGDLAIAGGNIDLTGKASVAGDLLIAGGSVIIDAPVKGDIRVAGGNVTINSKVGGKVYARASKSLSFGSGADVAGEVNYKGISPAIVDAAAKTGTINYTKIEPNSYAGKVAGLLTLGFLIKLLAWLIAGYVVLKFLKNFILSLREEVTQKPWANLGVGFLTLIAPPILFILLLITFVGYYLAALLAISYALLLVSTGLISALVLGYYTLSKMNKPGEVIVEWQALLIGVVIWVVLDFIPVLGWIAKAIIFLMVLGAVTKRLKGSVSPKVLV